MGVKIKRLWVTTVRKTFDLKKDTFINFPLFYLFFLLTGETGYL